MDSESLEEIKNLNIGCALSTHNLQQILQKLLKLEQLLEESCITEVEIYNFLVSLLADIKNQVVI